jgi:phospholipase/carboxylesterase
VNAASADAGHRRGELRAGFERNSHASGVYAATAKRDPSGVEWLYGPEGQAAALVVPPTLPAAPVPLVVLLHGAGSQPAHILPMLQGQAVSRSFLLLAPRSLGPTWDIIRGGFGPDVAALDQLLGTISDSYAVDHARVAIAGFSDGASYALTLGLINGTLFSRMIAFSPGFLVPRRQLGRPSVFISHGTQDPVLPIERCSRRLVPALRAQGYPVDYREFVGGHTVPPEIIAAALDFLE